MEPYNSFWNTVLYKLLTSVRRTRHAGHCWRSRDELIRDVLLWIPTHGRAKAGRPARTYIQQLCEDTGCCPEDLPRAMNDREEWRKRVRDIRAASTIWWWWWYIFKFKYHCLFFNRTDNPYLPILSLIRTSLHVNRLASGWIEFKKTSYFSPRILSPSTGAIFRGWGANNIAAIF